MKYFEDEKLTKLTSELTDTRLGRSRSIHGRVEAYTMKRAGTDKKYANALKEHYVAEMETVESQLAEYKAFMQKHVGLEGLNNKDKSSASSKGRKRSVSTGSQLEAVNPTKQQRKRSSSFDDTLPLVTSSFQKSALGDFGEMGTRRLMTDLILTLNASFPDYDFGSVKPSDFEKIKVSNAMQRVNERLSGVAVERSSFLPSMWGAIDEVVRLSDCEVYTYAPKASDEDEDPLSFLTQTLIDAAMDQQSESSSSMSSGNFASVLWNFNYFFVNKSLKRIVFFTCVECMKNEDPTLIQEEDDASFVKFTGTEASDVDFDLDPSADIAGGIAISIM